MIATVRSTPNEPGDITLLPSNRDAKPKRLTSVNDSLLSQYQLGSIEEITFDSFDGRNIQGWIIKPPDFDPSKEVCILARHSPWAARNGGVPEILLATRQGLFIPTTF
jgi:dipeptidyl aminopeptidase/acylaminoacyl peptidase